MLYMLELRTFPEVLASITQYAKFVQTQQLRSCTPVKVSFDKMNAFCCLLLSCEYFISGGEEEQISLSFRSRPFVRVSIQSMSAPRKKHESPSFEDFRIARRQRPFNLQSLGWLIILNLMCDK